MTQFTLAAVLWLAAQSADAPLPVSPAGLDLRKTFDGMDVEHRWLPDKHITAWKTGEADDKKGGPRTHCSLFVAAACGKLNAPMLEPPSQFLLANRQQAWLETEGAGKGWQRVPTPLEAQKLANRGVVVVATWRNPDPKKAGHVAMVRPAEVRPSDLLKGGPRITQAGGTNAADTDAKTGFKNHPGAWEKDEIRYFAHKPVSLKVAVFVGGGARKTRGAVADTLERLPGVEVEHLTAEDIRAGRLKEFQVVIHPGGSGSGQAKDLGEEGRAKEKEFIKAGGGYVGICAGSYLASRSYDWSLHVLDANVVDREHWARGTGTVELTLSPKGKDFFAAPNETLSIYYGQGPLLAPGGDDAIPDYEGLAEYRTEIHTKGGAKPGVMKGTTAAARGTFGSGRVFCFSPHPEKTPDETGAMLHKAVLWAAGR